MPHFLIWTIALFASSLVFFGPLNFFLAMRPRAAVTLCAWSTIILALLWAFYWEVPKESGFGTTSTFISCLVGLSVLLHYLAARVGRALEGRVAPERAYGWILFGSIISLVAVISVPLFASLTLALTRKL